MNSVVKMPVIEYRAMPQNEEQRNNYIEEMEGLLTKAKKEQRSLSIAEQNRFNDLKRKVGEIDRNINEAEIRSLDNKTVITKRSKNTPLTPKEKEEIRAFIDYIRTGESRDLAGANNGAVIPLTIANKIVDRVFEISPLMQNATIYNVGEDLNLPIYDYSAHVTTFITEFTDIVTSSGTFASVAMKSKIIGTLSKLGKSLVNRTDIDVLPFIVDACAKSVARFLENEIIKNTNNRFASTLPNGVTQTVTAGTAGAITPVDLVELKNSIPSMMLPNAKWLMHKDTLTYIQSLRDADGRLLFGNNLSEAMGNTLLGYEVMLSDAMPVMGVGARQIYFGDFTEGLAIKLGAQSAEVYKELYAAQYAYGIGHFMEVDTSASHSAQSISVLIGA